MQLCFFLHIIDGDEASDNDEGDDEDDDEDEERFSRRLR